MTLEELEQLCRDAARDVLAQEEARPLPAVVVLPQPGATQLIRLPDFPADDEARFDLLAGLAAERMRPVSAPCYGFVAEATADDGQEVMLIAFGARGHRPRVSAAPLQAGELGRFVENEELDPAALPFLAPLQRAVDGAQASQA